MDGTSPLARLRYGVVQCAGLGLLAGAFETVHLASSLKLPLSLGRFLLLGVVDALVMAVVAAALGAVAGAVHLVMRQHEAATPLAMQIAGCTFLLTGYYLWQGAVWTATVGQQPIGAAAMAAMPIGFAGVVYFNARFALRRAAARASRPEPPAPSASWLVVAAGGAALIVVVASILGASRDTGGELALEGDRNLVIVTVDGLRRDQVGAFGGPATPRLDALASRAVVFEDAVTPTPGSRAANATVLVGLHPLRHRVLADEHVLSRGYRSLFETLAKEGWATGGFVSSTAAVAGSGLDQGLLTYDDDFVPALAGISRINLLRNLLGASSSRPGGATVQRFEGWLSRHADRPFAAWIHLADPHLAAVAGEDGGVAEVDEAVGRVWDALGEHGVVDRTMVFVAGTHGDLRGAHGGQVNRTLYDEVVRVPLLMWAPGTEPVQPRVDAQVRLMDLANTALQWLELDRMDASEGIELIPYSQGDRSKTIWCPLVGRDLDGDWLIGLRNNGVKYIQHPDGREELYQVTDDPAEARDLSDEQPTVVAQAKSLLAADMAALRRLLEG